MKKGLLTIAVVAAVVSLFNCAKSVTGTSDETLVRSAKVYSESLEPAPDVAVNVYRVDDTLRVPAYQTQTDASGSYEVQVAKGMYNVLIGDDENGAFQDSVLFGESFSTLKDDTLGRTGVLRGRVVLQSIDDPRTAVVQVVGTNKYSNVSEDGGFVISGLPDGVYLLRATSTQDQYTPTYQGFTIATSGSDTTDMTVELVYTGIPVVKNIGLTYDTLKNEVKLTWDTTTYFLFRTFQIYQVDDNGGSLQFLGTSDRCEYVLHGGTAGQTMNFRVGIQSKSLSSGPTLETVSVICSGDITAYLKDTLDGTIGMPCTLSMVVENAGNAAVVYAWDIGATGTFSGSSGPDTVFTVSEGLTKTVQCIGRVTVGGSVQLFDTVMITFIAGWEKTGNQAFPQQWMTGVVEMNGRLYLFTQDANVKTLWESEDATAWEKVGTLNIPNECSKPVVFKNTICVADTLGYLWTSDDGVAWEKGHAPICSTFVMFGSAAGPVGNRNYAPQLFVMNDLLHVKPNTGTVQQDSIYNTDDLVSWKDAGVRYPVNVADCAAAGDATLICGFSWAVAEWRLGIVEGDSVVNLPAVYELKMGVFPPDGYSYSFSAAAFQCFSRGTKYYVFVDGNPLFIWDTAVKAWAEVPIPESKFGQSSIGLVFNDKLMEIGTDGVFMLVE